MSLAARLPKQVDGAAPVVPLHPHVSRPRVAELDQSVVRPVLDEVRRRLSEATGTSGLSDAALRVRVEAELASVLSDPEFAVAAVDLDRVRSGVVNEILGFGLLQDLLDNPEISEIMVNGANNVYVESHGVVSRLPRVFDSDDQLIAVINRMVRLTGRRIDQTSPMVDARLPDGSRLNAVLPPLTVDGPSVTIRKFTANNLTVARLTELGSLSPEAADLLQLAVEQRLNILVSGGTGTGKTTLLNVLSSFIDRDNRVITVEDAVELSLDLPNMIRLETRPANILSRLETMVLLGGVDLPLRAIREQIGSAIDLIVQVARDVSGARFVSSITEVVGLESDVISTADLFTRSPVGGVALGTPLGADGRVSIATPLVATGIVCAKLHGVRSGTVA